MALQSNYYQLGQVVTLVINTIKGMIMRLHQKLVFLVLLIATFKALAWDGSITGEINRIDVTSGNNYGFRVTLNNSPKLCGNEHSWAYLNESDSNYKTYVSVLLAAKMGGVPVHLYVNKETTSGHDFCHIGYIVLK